MAARPALGFVAPLHTFAGSHSTTSKTLLNYRTSEATDVSVDIDALLNKNDDDIPAEEETSRLGRIKNRIKRRLSLMRRFRSRVNVPSVTRLYSGEDGQSHLEAITLSVDDFVDVEGAFGQATPWLSCDRMTIRQVPPEYEHSWHNAPRRQYVVQLQGRLEIEVASGAKAVIGPGDVLLAEDTMGQGHITRQKGDGPCIYAVVVIAQDGNNE